MSSSSPVMILTLGVAMFVITMILAVGPLMMCRLFAGKPRPACGRGPSKGVATGLAVLGAALFAVIGIYHARGVRSTSANAIESVPEVRTVTQDVAVGAEQSLFNTRTMSAAMPHRSTVRVDHLSWLGVLLPVILVTAVLGFIGNRFRGRLLRLAPVGIAGGAVLMLYFVSTTQHQQHQAHVDHRHAQTLDREINEAARWEPIPMMSNPFERSVNDHAVPVELDAEAEHDEETVLVNSLKTDQIESPAVVVYVGSHSAGQSRAALPNWATDSDDNGSIRLIQSGRHATVALAEEQALDQLRAVLTSEFIQHHPEAAGWEPNDATLMQSGSILQRAIERSEVQVGDFTNPMYEAYWQVETTNHDALYKAWRPSIVHWRLAWLGGGLGLLTLLFGSLAAVLRVDEETGGQKRKQLVLGTSLVWVALCSAVLLLA